MNYIAKFSAYHSTNLGPDHTVLVTMPLFTLIWGTLDFKIQLLFKTILHHDAFRTIFFSNMQRVANSMTILFEFKKNFKITSFSL